MLQAESLPALVDRLTALADAGQLGEAVAECRALLAQDSGSSELWGCLATLELRAENTPAAIAAHKKEADVLLHIGDLERALGVLKRVVQLAPQDAEAQLALANIYRTLGQTHRAALAYELAGLAFSAHGRVKESLAAIQQLVDMSEQNIGRRVRLAEQYTKAGFFEDAGREFRTAAAALRRANRLDEYGQVVERLCALESQRIETNESSAESASAPAVLSPSAESEAASRRTPTRDVASAVNSQSEDLAAARIAEAESFLRLGLVDKANAHLASALIQNPYLKQLRKALVRLYADQHDHGAAVGELWVLCNQSASPAEEIGYLRLIVRLEPEDEAARERLAELSEQSVVVAPETRDVPASIDAVDRELRSELGEHRPATDVAVTREIRPPALLLLQLHIRDTGAARTVLTTQELSPEDIEEELLITPVDAESTMPHLPDSARLSHFQNGLSLFAHGRYSECIAPLEDALPEPALGVRVSLLLARAFNRLNRPQDAIRALQRGLGLQVVTDQAVSELLYELGETYLQIGDQREAVFFYRLAMGKDGRYRDATAKVATIEASSALAK